MPPAGYKRSRALWDEARRPGASWCDMAHAILYEVQPVRSSQANVAQIVTAARGILQSILYAIRSLPGMGRVLLEFLKTRTKHHWFMAAIAVGYYGFVRWVHSILDAGPIVIILSSLAAIFTVGLSDNANGDGMSAYSVFNRGFEQLLGSVDVDSLLAQHVGGGFGGVGVGLPQLRQTQLVGHQQLHWNGTRGHPANPPNNPEDEEDDDGDNEGDDENATNNNNRSRKSGKKARRRNLEQRRELQRQRDAALALGIQGNEGPEEMMAMQRLIEERIAAENQDQNQAIGYIFFRRCAEIL